jgi:hypothetical protein
MEDLMANSFVYSIANDIPGGEFSTDESNRLLALIGNRIATQLSNISATGDVLTVTFVTDITAAEKTALDGDQLAPAGGAVGACADYVELTVSSVIVNSGDELNLTPDGIESIALDFQLKDGFGVAKNAPQRPRIRVFTGGLIPITRTRARLGTDGTRSLIVGPTFSRGTIDLSFDFQNLPPINITIDSGGNEDDV